MLFACICASRKRGITSRPNAKEASLRYFRFMCVRTRFGDERIKVSRLSESPIYAQSSSRIELDQVRSLRKDRDQTSNLRKFCSENTSRSRKTPSLK